MKTKTSTSSNKFAEEVEACNYELKTKQEATSYSNSEDESKRSSTIDLTFAKQSLSQSVEYCEGLRVPGFLTDHRVIETLVKRTVKTAFKTMPCWHKMTPEKFQRHLKPRLPPLDSPVGSEEQVVDLFAKVIHALHVTTMENVPRRFCGLRLQDHRSSSWHRSWENDLLNWTLSRRRFRPPRHCRGYHSSNATSTD